MPKQVIADASTAAGARQRSAEPLPGPTLALTIVSHPMAHRAGERCLLRALAAGKEVALTRNGPDFAKPGSALGEPLADPFVSRKPIRLVPAGQGRIQLVTEGGTPMILREPIPLGRQEIGPDDLARGVLLELAERVVLLLHPVIEETGARADTLGLVGESAGVWRVRAQVERIADLCVPVLIRGETGTGKELVARAIHEHSPRRAAPFVSVNLGAIPRELAAAELFGAHRGAYTGATRDRVGYFAAARGGSLFLDEVGEASPEVQGMLLRVLETGEMYPVGGATPVATDVRLIAATDADLEERIRDGRFKAPLLHRLAGYEIRLPPLRERREDIGVLFHHFARQELEAIGEAHRLAPGDPHAEPWLPASLAAQLVRCAWPGNIRQLRNVARQIVIGSRGQARAEIDPRLTQELGEGTALGPPRRAARAKEDSEVELRRKPSEVTEAEVLAALRENGWDLKAAADRLGIPRTSMYDVIERCPGIRTAGDVSAEEIAQCFCACGGDLEEMVKRLEVSGRALKRRLKELGLSSKRA